MTGHELYKLVSVKAVLLIIVVAVSVNVFILWQTEKNSVSYTADEYIVLWDECIAEAEEYEWAAVLERLENKLETFNLDGLKGKEKIAFMLSDEYNKKSLYMDVHTEVEAQLGYGKYLEGIQQAAEQYKTLMFFGKTDSYAYREIQQISKLYAGIDREELEPESSKGVEMAAESGVADIIAIVILLCIAVIMWLKEREQNVMILVRTTYRGRIRLARSKLMVMVLSSIFIGLTLYGNNFIAALVMYGVGDLERPLASVYEYRQTLWEISVGEFLVLNVFFKICAYMWVALLMSAVCCRLTDSVGAFGLIFIFGAIGCLMYYKIPHLSKLVAFKYLNPFAMLKTELLFTGYIGFNFFGYPVDYRLCVAVLFPVGIVFFAVLTMIFFTDYVLKNKMSKCAIFTKLSYIVRLKMAKLEMHTSMFGHELYRLFICSGVGVVLTIFVVFVSYNSKPYKVTYSALEDYYEYMYLEMLKGPVTQEKKDYVEAEKAQLEALDDDFSKAQKRALMVIEEKIKYWEENEGAYFIYDVPHDILTAAYGNKEDIFHAVLCMIPIVLVMPCFFAPDLQNGVCKIVDVTKRGKCELPRMRYALGTGLAVFIATVAYIPYFVQVVVSYKIEPEVFSYPVNSLIALAGLGNRISIGIYYIIIYALRMLFTVFGAFLVYGISRIIKSQVYTTLAGFIVLVVPALVVLYDMRLEPVMYPYSAVLGNLFMQDSAAATVCIVAVAVIVLVILLMRNVKRGKIISEGYNSKK